MDRLPVAFVQSVGEGRFHDAATDAELLRRWKEEGDAVARALLILCAAHHHCRQANSEGARMKAARAVRYLEREPLDPYAALLIEHARQLLGALQAGVPVPPLPLGFR
jgi:predicted metal-dependent hydrolase